MNSKSVNTGLILALIFTLIFWWAISLTVARLRHECPEPKIPFLDYMPDPIASQKYLGLEPDGYPYEDFGKEWVRRWLDESAQLLFEVE